MASQKFIKYSPLDLSGKQLDSEYKLKLNILEISGNYLYIKIFYGILILKDNLLVRLKPEVKFKVEDENPGVKKVLDEQEQVQIVHLYGKGAVLFLVQNQKKSF